MDKGASQALQLFHGVARSVPAYQKFLKKNRVNLKDIKSIEDFYKLPIITKNNYLRANNLEDLFPAKKIPPTGYASSGSSGYPTFWFRGDDQEKIGGDIHERIIKNVFKIKKEDSTLVVICFSMGVWAAGSFTLSSFKELHKRGYNISTITPGLDKEDILNIFSNLAPNFKNLIVVGYPPFLMDIALEAAKRKIKLKNNIKFLSSGEKFTEEWRSDFLSFLKITDSNACVNIYGSADACVLGYETPLSIFLRKEAVKNKQLYYKLFGEDPVLPGLFQYDPTHVFFESINGELVLTAPTASPLIRYNIHDHGHVIQFNEILKIVKDSNLDSKFKRIGLSSWNLPFVIKKGRSDVAVTFYALNIYPENIKAGLEEKKINKFVSGQFFAFNKNLNKNRDHRLFINIELAPGKKPKKNLLQSINKSILHNLLKLNIEYRKLYSVIGDKATPKLKLFPFGGLGFVIKEEIGVLAQKGKKPRVLR